MMSESNQSDTSLTVDAAPVDPRSLDHEVTCVGSVDTHIDAVETELEPQDAELTSESSQSETSLSAETVSVDKRSQDNDVHFEINAESSEIMPFKTEPDVETNRKKATDSNLSADDVGIPNEQLSAETRIARTLSLQTRHDTGSTERCTDDVPIDMRTPGPGWRFNLLLDKISESLEGNDFKRLKSFFHYSDGLGEAVLEEINDSWDLFRVLKTRGFIHEHNLAYLQSGLYHLGRIDLVKSCVEYARNKSGTLYVYSQRYHPENGYKFAKFHIAGEDFTKKTDKVLRMLTYTISEILCIPVDHIFIVGVDHTQSLLVTVMMREDYIQLLEQIIHNERVHSMLWDVQIDMVHVEGRTFRIDGVEIEEVEQEPQMSTIHQQLDDARKQLHEAELAILEQSQRIIKRTEKETYEWERKTMLDMFNACSTADGDNLDSKRKHDKELEHFSELLHKVKHNYDPNLIGELLVLNSNIAQWFVQDNVRSANRKLMIQKDHLQRAINKERYVWKILQLLTKANTEDPTPVDQLMPLRNEVIAFLEELNGELSEIEKDTIRAMYTLKPGNISTALANHDKQCLHGIVMKEQETGRLASSLEDLERFMFELFEHVENPSLKTKYLELLQKHNIQPKTISFEKALEISVRSLSENKEFFQTFGNVFAEIASPMFESFMKEEDREGSEVESPPPYQEVLG